MTSRQQRFSFEIKAETYCQKCSLHLSCRNTIVAWVNTEALAFQIEQMFHSLEEAACPKCLKNTNLIDSRWMNEK